MEHSKGSYPIHFEGSSAMQELSVPNIARRDVWGQPFATDASLFTSSLPVFSHEKLEFSQIKHVPQSTDVGLPIKKTPDSERVVNGTLVDDDSCQIEFTLPDDEEELLAGAMEDFDLSGLPSSIEDLEDDIFGSGGGMELDADPKNSFYVAVPKPVVAEGFIGSGANTLSVQSGVGTISGEHPSGEHPSRTLFVRNINSNVEDSELRTMFEQYGDIRTLYTACKHRGFVMVSYYDIRDARTAMRLLQNKPLRRRKLDIHFSIPKDNPSEKDINQGTLVVFNLDASVSNDDLRRIFGSYGEVKEIRETPHKNHHRFIEYYDVRHAEAALKALNRCDIAGKRIKLEHSRPGGIRRNFMLHPGQEVDQEDALIFRHLSGSPVTSSPSVGYWQHLSSSVDSNTLRSFGHRSGTGSFSPLNRAILPGLGSILPSQISSSPRAALTGKGPGFANINLPRSPAYHHSMSYPEVRLKASPGPISPLSESNSNSFGTGTLSGPQYLWGSPTLYSGNTSSASWSTTSTDHPVSSIAKERNIPFSNVHRSIPGIQNHHHVGSAPSGAPFTRQVGYFSESPDTSLMKPVTFTGLGYHLGTGDFMMNMGSHGAMKETASPSSVMSFQKEVPMFIGNSRSANYEGFAENGWIQRVENGLNLLESKKQYQLNVEKIISGEDTRTTLMIKNIPNKYTSKMLLAAIDENHRGTYDFLYLPIDFKNKCNVGYAFINMISPSNIVSFYQAFNGKRWEKFNSEKVASLAYGRIQGKAALIMHFHNSSLMNEDKRCRPILFRSEGQETSDLDPLPSGNLNICIRQLDGSYSGDTLNDTDDNFD